MEWIPKCLDNLDSTALALYQSWVGFYRWVLLRLALTIVAVAAITISPTIRLVAIAIVTTFAFFETIDRLVSRRRRLSVARAKS